MVKDLIQNTLNNLKKNKIKSINDVYSSKEFLVSLSSKYMSIENDIKTFLKSKMYNNSDVVNKNNEGKKIISYLFNKIKDNPKRFLNKAQLNGDLHRNIADYISGMTDRYAINLYKKLKWTYLKYI